MAGEFHPRLFLLLFLSSCILLRTDAKPSRKSSVPSSSDLYIVPLGHPVPLGTLYDIRTQKFLDESIFENPKDLPPSFIKIDRPTSSLHGLYERNLILRAPSDKFELLGIHSRQSLGYQVNQTSTSPNSTTFLQTITDSENNFNETFYEYRFRSKRTRREQFDLDHEDATYQIQFDKLSDSTATHVLVKIEWGVALLARTPLDYEKSNLAKDTSEIFGDGVDLTVFSHGRSAPFQIVSGPVQSDDEGTSSFSKFKNSLLSKVRTSPLKMILKSNEVDEIFEKFPPSSLTTDDKAKELRYVLTSVEDLKYRFGDSSEIEKKSIIKKIEQDGQNVNDAKFILDEIDDVERRLSNFRQKVEDNKDYLETDAPFNVGKLLGSLKKSTEELKKGLRTTLGLRKVKKTLNMRGVLEKYADSPGNFDTVNKTLNGGDFKHLMEKIKFVNWVQKRGIDYFGRGTSMNNIEGLARSEEDTGDDDKDADDDDESKGKDDKDDDDKSTEDENDDNSPVTEEEKNPFVRRKRERGKKEFESDGRRPRDSSTEDDEIESKVYILYFKDLARVASNIRWLAKRGKFFRKEDEEKVDSKPSIPIKKIVVDCNLADFDACDGLHRPIIREYIKYVGNPKLISKSGDLPSERTKTEEESDLKDLLSLLGQDLVTVEGGVDRVVDTLEGITKNSQDKDGKLKELAERLKKVVDDVRDEVKSVKEEKEKEREREREKEKDRKKSSKKPAPAEEDGSDDTDGDEESPKKTSTNKDDEPTPKRPKSKGDKGRPEPLVIEGSNPQCKIIQEGVDKHDRKKIRDAHNEYRKRVSEGKEQRQPQPKAPLVNLTWSDELAEKAQQWAYQCNFNHNPDKESTSFEMGVGENLYRSMRESKAGSLKFPLEANWTAAVQTWYDEVKDFPPEEIDEFQDIETLGKKQIGHYTQIVWEKTTHVGCGYVQYYQGDGAEFLYVCNYGPRGNFRGQPVYKI